MVVAVEMITYNHGSYISDAIDGVVNQKTNFPFCLYLFEDCSTDDTQRICKEYAEKYPSIIKLHANDKNIGVTKNARQLHDTTFSSPAKYIAICEGDDYWTDNLKLQKQVDFLDSHPDFSVCFHRVYERRGDVLSLSKLNADVDRTYTILDLARHNLIHTPSVLFRNELKTLPEWFYNSPAGDYLMHMMNAQKGLIRYMAEPMAVYRIHEGGQWSTKPREQTLENWRKTLSFLLRVDFQADVMEQLLAQRRRTETELLKIYQQKSPEIFLEKLREFSAEDPQLAQDWLLEHYPAQLSEIKNSGSYKLAQKLANINHKFLGRFRR